LTSGPGLAISGGFLHAERCSAIAANDLPRPGWGVNEVQARRAMSVQKIEVCKTGDVDEGAAIKVETGDLILAVFNLNGAFYVMDDTCSHGPGSLSEGPIHGDVVECDFHNGSFNIKTGEVVDPPCMIPQKTYKVIVEGDAVFIEA
jgi:nitrite reductase/ring-hydroxylating ferredoxin subunit